MSGTRTASDLSAEGLMETVSRRTGSDDWGAGPFVEALRMLLSCAHDETLNDLGRRVLRSIALRHLRNRLEVQAFIQSHNDMSRAALPRTIVITGLPRTATTALQQLLVLDPAHRPLRLWEALRPAPAAGADDRSARVAAAEDWLRHFYEAVPLFRTIHPLTADGPEECDALLQNSFASRHFDDMFDVPAYSTWFSTASLADEYTHYATQLRVLASRDATPARWLLKSPSHLGHLDALLRVLPDALIVHCHRDPLQAVPSYASLIATLRGAYSVRVDPMLVGAQAMRRCESAVTRALAVRETAIPGHFIDVAHDQVVSDPIAAVRVVYAAAGETLKADVEQRMREWARLNRRGSHGEHRYSAAEFGIDAAAIGESFAAYTDRFEALVRWS